MTTIRKISPEETGSPGFWACHADAAPHTAGNRLLTGSLVVAAHGALLGAALFLSGFARPVPAPRPEPELVFMTLGAPPPAAAGATSPASPPPPRRQARRRPATPRPELAMRVPDPEPVPVVEQPAEEETPAVEEASVAEATPPGNASGPGAGGSGAGVGAAAPGVRGGTGVQGLGGFGGAVDLRQVSQPPRLIERVPPRYPSEARSRRVEGLVLLRLVIGTDGRVEYSSVRALRSVPDLDLAAMTAVRQWRFSPGVGHSGRPVRVVVDIPVQFTLT